MWPTANVGIRTGAESGLVVLDVDRRKGGAETLAGLALPQTLTVETGDGVHYYFQHPGGSVPNASDALPGIDRKGDGGYIVAPPSLHASGRVYRFIAAWPADWPLVSLPAFALNGTRPAARPGTPGERIPQGQRNEALASLAGSMRRRGMTTNAITAALIAENAARCDPPLPEPEVEGIARSVARYEPAEATAGAIHFPRTDAGNGEMFAALYGDRVRYDHRRKRWLRWAGHWWEPDADAEVRRLAKAAARQRYRDGAAIEDLKEREAEARWAISSEARMRMDATLALAQSEKPIADAGDSWDWDAWLLGAANGVVDLRSGVLRAGRPEDRVTQNVPIAFDPEAKCPRWVTFLEEVFNGDAEIIDFIQRAMGYSLTGNTAEQCLFLCIGNGANGKTVFLAVLRLLGGEYAYNMPFSTVELTSRATIPNDLADLDRRRIVTASETAEGSRLNESRLKALTGGDPITARHLFGEFFTFEPQAKLWLAANHRPRVDDLSYAFWRRIRLIPFMRQFRDDADKVLLDKLRAESPGILAWAARGALEWQRRGLEPPGKVRAATDDYRRESDPLTDFLAERCFLATHATARAATLFVVYVEWAKVQGLREREMLGSRTFGARMTERFSKCHDKKGWYYVGIGLSGDGSGPETYTENPSQPSPGDGLGQKVTGYVSETPENEFSPIQNPLRETYTKDPSHPSPVTVDPQRFTCLRCGNDEPAYDGDGALYCPACRREAVTP